MDIGEGRGLRRVEGGGGPQGCRDDDASWRAAGGSHAKRNFKKKKRQFGIITPIMLHRDGGSTSSRHQRLPPFVYPSQLRLRKSFPSFPGTATRRGSWDGQVVETFSPSPARTPYRIRRDPEEAKASSDPPASLCEVPRRSHRRR